VAGVHLNMLFPYVREEPGDLTSAERARLEAMRAFRATGSAVAPSMLARLSTPGRYVALPRLTIAVLPREYAGARPAAPGPIQ